MSPPLFTLPSGDKIPSVAFGTAPVDERYLTPEFLEDVLKRAIQNGHRHFDEAEMYTTEPVLGSALKAFPAISRSELFITSKVHPWMGIKHKDVEGALLNSLKALGLDYIDLYLIHMPFLDVEGLTLEETWASMESVKAKGLVRHIGVSNFRPSTLERLLKSAVEKPEVNQIELHPYHFEHDTVDFCREHNILVAAYSPLAPLGPCSDGPLAPILNSIADKYNVTPGQILLKWQHQQGFLPVTSTTRDERQKALLNLDFTLEECDVRLITEKGATWHEQLFRWGMGTPREGEDIEYDKLMAKSL
ncbi:hypothetical protein SERLA73DRAFT_184454 [Serpula lacrymans var. lacrymans S7.3]|uniref:NADP-dependent oxidoreductase domain-containing protein n=2 Tax=Serpula lacrymans var. lacrymans TaxID=341189 RepID=F8Q398_SERL3|nr:oxidoreductase [Serpula lacrymans var. lacrymans S7.9]EGN97659.1 hypothetical protein SERLA73DRAFT_184454 [Serpula lacrymans var. lacrymans S7.3]EGO23254.1 oxidoreductase [Serpula lacrymans var. lacrymans S7.9]